MADEDKRPDEEQRNSDPEFEEDPAPKSDPEFETDEPAQAESHDSDEAGESSGSDAEEQAKGTSAPEFDPMESEDTLAAPVADIVAQVKAEKGEEHSGAHGGAIGHVAPMPLLMGVLAALILLTILTVGVTAVDLGGQGNFIVAMVIATVKAVLVMGYFMHLFWDSKFNVIAFASSFLFALLFLGMALLDRQETQSSINAWEADQQMMQK